MTPFDRAIAFVLLVEGEWSDDDPDSPRGRTRWGISADAHPDVDLDTLTRAGASAIYRTAYWDRAHCDRLPGPLSLILFDGAVQHDVPDSARFLQAALHVEVDGLVGPETIAAAQAAPTADVLRDALARRAVYYAQSPKVRFRLGWYRRLFALQQAAFTMSREG